MSIHTDSIHWEYGPIRDPSWKADFAIFEGLISAPVAVKTEYSCCHRPNTVVYQASGAPSVMTLWPVLFPYVNILDSEVSIEFGILLASTLLRNLPSAYDESLV